MLPYITLDSVLSVDKSVRVMSQRLSPADQAVCGAAVRHRELPGCLSLSPADDGPSFESIGRTIDAMMGSEHVLLSQHAPDTTIDMALKPYHANGAAGGLETAEGSGRSERGMEGGREIKDGRE